MRAHEFITEKKSGKKTTKKTNKKPHPEHEAVMPSAYKVASAMDKLHDLNRVMRAAASSDGKSIPKLDDTWFGLSDTAHPYTKEEAEILKKAFKAANVEWKDVLHPNALNKSKEPNGTNTSSPMKGFAGYGNNKINEASRSQTERDRREQRKREFEQSRIEAEKRASIEAEIENARREIQKAKLNKQLTPNKSIKEPTSFTFGGVQIPVDKDETPKPVTGNYIFFKPREDGSLILYWIKEADLNYQRHDGSNGLDSARKLRKTKIIVGDINAMFNSIKDTILDLRKIGAVRVVTDNIVSSHKPLVDRLGYFIDAYDDELIGIE